MSTRRKKKGYRPEESHASLSSGEAIAMLRQLKGWTQEKLAKASGIAATNLSRLENGHLFLGKRRALAPARALGVHPATLMFPEISLRRVA